MKRTRWEVYRNLFERNVLPVHHCDWQLSQENSWNSTEAFLFPSCRDTIKINFQIQGSESIRKRREESDHNRCYKVWRASSVLADDIEVCGEKRRSALDTKTSPSTFSEGWSLEVKDILPSCENPKQVIASCPWPS